MTRHTFTRQALYDMVWAEPTKTVAARLGVSDVTLAKACRSVAIPLPFRGYWARSASGQKILRTPLPPRGLGMAQKVRVGGGRYEHVPYSEQIGDLDASEPDLPDFGEPIEAVRTRVTKQVGKVSFPVVVTRTHPETKKLLDIDEQRRRKRERSSFPQFEKEVRFDGPVGQRRLRILNALFLVLSRSGAAVTLGRGMESDWGFSLEGSRVVHFEFDVQSRLDAARERRSIRQQKEGQPDPLILSLGPSAKVWNDKDQPLDKIMSEIVVECIVYVESDYRRDVLRNHNWVLERREEGRKRRAAELVEAERVAREQRAKQEKERIGRLLDDARALREAVDLRAYIEAVRTSAPIEGATAQDIDAWSRWALAQAAKRDPILNGRLQTSIDESRSAEQPSV